MGSWDKRKEEQQEEEEQVLKLPGFRFHPTDQELVGFYLSKKVLLKKSSKIDEIISQIDIYKFDPWDLPRKFFHSLVRMFVLQTAQFIIITKGKVDSCMFVSKGKINTLAISY